MISARKTENQGQNDNRVECPFSIHIVDPKYKNQKKRRKYKNQKKRRRTDAGKYDDASTKIKLQMSPFGPSGKFKTHKTMDLHYQVKPTRQWTDMTRYNSFVLHGVKYFREDFIYVANDFSIERQKKAGEAMSPEKKSDDYWVARILEIRAGDEHHVYARVYWMYWPYELPQGTHDGKKTVHGRQPYHGANELIASNHMDIINVMSVTSQAQVKQWYEENEEEIQHALYWRQALDVRTYELSTVELVCSCNTPAHPDNLLVGCISENCKKWMHEQCIEKDALCRIYARLGRDKPHLKPISQNEDEAKRPLSPTEPGAAVSAHCVDMKADSLSDSAQVNKENVDVKQSKEKDAPGVPEDSIAEPSLKPPTNKDINGDSAKPWEGLFEVNLRMGDKYGDETSMTLEFKDLREGIKSGEKTWTESVKCLVCGNSVN